MNEQALQNEAKLKESNKTIESLKTTSTQSVNWSSVSVFCTYVSCMCFTNR